MIKTKKGIVIFMETSITDFISGKFHEIQTRVPVKLNGFAAAATDGSPAQVQSFEEQLKAAGINYVAANQDAAAGSAEQLGKNGETGLPGAAGEPDTTGSSSVVDSMHVAGNDYAAGMGTVIFPNIRPAPPPEPERLSQDGTGIAFDGYDPDGSSDFGANLAYLNQYGDAEVQKVILNAVSEAAEKHQVNESLIKAVIMQESSFSPTALSHVGAQGLMQLMPETADYLGVSNPWDIYENIDGGTRLIGKYLDDYDGDLELVLSAYNAGPGAVEKYGGIPPYSETQNYVRKVIGYFDKYLEEWY